MGTSQSSSLVGVGGSAWLQLLTLLSCGLCSGTPPELLLQPGGF